MNGGFDLYGKYYSNKNDAEMAEMAQCDEIDNRHLRSENKHLQDRINQLEDQLRYQNEDGNRFA